MVIRLFCGCSHTPVCRHSAICSQCLPLLHTRERLGREQEASDGTTCHSFHRKCSMAVPVESTVLHYLIQVRALDIQVL